MCTYKCHYHYEYLTLPSLAFLNQPERVLRTRARPRGLVAEVAQRCLLTTSVLQDASY